MHVINYKILKKPGRHSLRQRCSPYALHWKNHGTVIRYSSKSIPKYILGRYFCGRIKCTGRRVHICQDPLRTKLLKRLRRGLLSEDQSKITKSATDFSNTGNSAWKRLNSFLTDRLLKPKFYLPHVLHESLRHYPSGVLSGRIPCWTSVPHPCEVWHWWNTLVVTPLVCVMGRVSYGCIHTGVIPCFTLLSN